MHTLNIVAKRGDVVDSQKEDNEKYRKNVQVLDIRVLISFAHTHGPYIDARLWDHFA